LESIENKGDDKGQKRQNRKQKHRPRISADDADRRALPPTFFCKCAWKDLLCTKMVQSGEDMTPLGGTWRGLTIVYVIIE